MPEPETCPECGSPILGESQGGLCPRCVLKSGDQTRLDPTLNGAFYSSDFPTEAEELPATLSGHKILSEVGSGGMGRVLLARDEALGRTVAIKILHPHFRDHEQLRTRFMQEARAMARLNHPNIVRIYNLGSSNELPHIVMEYIEGASLLEVADALPLRQKIELLVKVVHAVEILHQNRIVHRDLKPGNILVGTDLEPKVLDFGLAQSVDEHGRRLTLAGEVMGTPEYFSPEQAQGDPSLDARSDIFSLGTILYVLLTGVTPFRAESFRDQLKMLREQDPVLPRRLSTSVPGALQNICLKALEKKPADRYASAREMAADLERYLTGEAVLANPTTYSRMMSGRVEQHLQELDGWKRDQILSEHEFEAFRKLYDGLFDKEDAWILEVRRLSFTQVTLYLGAWILVLGAALIFMFPFEQLSGTPAVLVVAAATIPTLWIGIRSWNEQLIRISIAYLLAFCLLLPIVFLVTFGEWNLVTEYTQGNPELEFWYIASLNEREPTEFTTNSQMWWAVLLSLPAYIWLRRFTRASVFSLVISAGLALFCLTTLLTLGLLDLEVGEFSLRLIPIAVFFFMLAASIERLRHSTDSRYFYPVAVLFTFAAFSGVALFHEPYAEWLEDLAPFTRGQIEYLFIINAAYYLVLQGTAQSLGTVQMRTMCQPFRFVIPGHILISLLLLSLAARDRWDGSPADAWLWLEARTFGILLPLVACAFVFWSIPKQMKNYLATGLVFLAIGVVMLQQDMFKDRAIWSISLVVTGIILMFVAANFTRIKISLKNLRNRIPA